MIPLLFVRNRSNYLKEDSLIYEESYEKATKIS